MAAAYRPHLFVHGELSRVAASRGPTAPGTALHPVTPPNCPPNGAFAALSAVA